MRGLAHSVLLLLTKVTLGIYIISLANCGHSLTHTTLSCLQVEEEDERKKKDSGRAHEVELLNL